MNDALGFIGCTVALLGSLVLALTLTQALARWAAGFGLRHGVVSPVTDRSSHAEPTSRLGGLALAGGFLLPATLFVTAIFFVPRSALGWGADVELLGWLALGALGMLATGLADDLWDIPPAIKLSGQILSALVLVPAGMRFMYLEIPPPPGFSPQMAQVFAAVCWVVFFVNVFNFMDGSDGFAIRFAMNVCAWIGVTVFLFAGMQGFVFFLRGEFLLVLILGASTQGFYRENRAPARIFMGDGGSHLVGYLLAILLLFGDGNYFAVWPALSPPIRAVPATTAGLFLLPFIFDVLVTLVRRARLGQNLLSPHREHLYQRLIRAGMSHRDVLLLNLRYFHLCGLLGLANSLIPDQSDEIPAAALLAADVGVWVLALLAMTHYWRGVVARERRTGAGEPEAAPAGA